jgi:hypothetical protein
MAKLAAIHMGLAAKEPAQTKTGRLIAKQARA